MAKRKIPRERRVYNDESKQQVLELVRTGGKTVRQVSQDLDLTESLVRRWINLDQTTNGIMTQNSLTETDQKELERLRTENKRLKIERDILKKAAAFFAKESM
ncbi:MAG: transposase-like protein [Granulosicoccus sp.]|jgi:transposase-like protein